MTAIEDARAAERGLTLAIDSTVRMGGCPIREMYAARDALRALIAEHERLIAEMHQRELHHFETEQMLVQAGLDPDAAPLTAEEREDLEKAIWWAVLEECCAHKGGEPHATDWNRDGYRREATLCERCARLIETLKALPGFRRQGPITAAEAWEEGRVAGGKHVLDIQAREHAGEPSPPSLTNPYEVER